MSKNIYFTLIFFWALGINMVTAQSYCKTPSNSKFLEYNTKLRNTIRQGGSRAPVTVRVYFHVIRRSNGTGGYLPYEVTQAFNVMQGDFNQHGIFFGWNGCIDYIDDDSYYNWNTGGIFNVNSHTDGIDAYLFPASHPSAGGLADWIGATAFWVAGTWGGTPVPFTHIISHEMGHCLFLWHTHHGIGEGGDPGECVEFVNGTNCAFCGDYVCDTPSDPFIGFWVDPNCQWLGSGTDPNGDPFDPDELNIMAYTDPVCMDYFTPGQGQRMFQAIHTLPILIPTIVNGSIPIDYCNCPAKDLIIDQNTTINQPLYVTGDIIVINGAHLTVTSTIYFKVGRGIDLFQNSKLIVNAGKLTTCESSWRGVRVTGGNSDFDVSITNGSVVEHTTSPAVSFFAPFPWPQIQNYGNGILRASNSTFNNTSRMVEFMSWTPLPNPSYIRYCTQNGGWTGISNWNCQGIEVTGNRFNNINAECIITETGSFTIRKNEFHSGQNDILFNNVSAGIPTVVESNNFYGSDYGYNARGTTFAQNRIFDNIFKTGFLDVMNDGINSFWMRRNTLNAFFGEVSFDNGNGIADVECNRFNGNFVGILPYGNNQDYNFYQNNFKTTFTDAYVIGDVQPLVHSGFLSPATNCFTHGGNPGGIVDIGGNPNPFNYLEPSDVVVNCYDAILANPNVNRIQFGKANPCGRLVVDDIYYDVCYEYADYAKAVDARKWLVDNMEVLQNGGATSDIEKEYQYAIYKKCLRKATGYLFEQDITNGNYEVARSWYQDDPSEEAKMFIFSSFIFENNLEKAKEYLYSLQADNEGFNDFLTIQKIYLDRLPMGPFYEASGETLEIVEKIANQTHPYAANGKALYYVLTGKVIKNRPSENLSGFGLRNNVKDEVVNVSIYPNPFDNLLNIEFEGNGSPEVTVVDLYGKEIYRQSNIKLKNISIDTDLWQKGMYLVFVKNNGHTITQQKVMLIE